MMDLLNISEDTMVNCWLNQLNLWKTARLLRQNVHVVSCLKRLNAIEAV